MCQFIIGVRNFVARFRFFFTFVSCGDICDTVVFMGMGCFSPRLALRGALASLPPNDGAGGKKKLFS